MRRPVNPASLSAVLVRSDPQAERLSGIQTGTGGQGSNTKFSKKNFKT
jgi:hypothetical protein